MSADTAYMICTNVEWPALGIRDTQVTHCNEAAAELHGYGSARDLVRRCLSELQAPEFRHAAQCQHLLREHGYPVDAQYATVMQAEDGESLGHRRQLVWRLSEGHGRLSYCVEITKVSQLSPVAVPDIALYGLTQEHFTHVCGERTVHQFKEAVRTKQLNTLPYPENLRTILARCRHLSTFFDDITDDTGVDLMLSSRVAWTLYGRTPGLVKVHQACEACGWQWLHAEAVAAECPQCRTSRA